ncbi:diadenylate cyclase CdaA [Bacteroidales bacterium OttesenSCG-928-B11]|nr:diadenylate cyclase CdaA [Bacteroidales bacterium OttesenSCG-928-E04]MDL2309494.1 diadenylate cyclase CdaA [Bacteroidales bacterium OttesenSCG-928-C03]MDL2313213.1 diadenylate cyclase CdaA [Bacteroidales bacterium OttesenSCG-928-B11]MDL2325482.1 diadenylate cyclase CdaA [Bacteroidales bacterium OttesenSCG-928-A14]
MALLVALDFISFKFTDLIDIFLVALILFELYSLLKGTSAIRIVWAIALLYVLYKLATLFHLGLISDIMGQVISVGMIALIVVFQPEIRSFLLFIGNRNFIQFIGGKFSRKDDPQLRLADIDAIVQACKRMSASKTGALIIIAKEAPLEDFLNTGEQIDARVSRELLENIFFKNSPLHDGAVVIKSHRIAAARCILPVSRKADLPTDLGLRHRSAIGATTSTDALGVIVSEQTGSISFCKSGELTRDISPIVLKQMLTDELVTSVAAEAESTPHNPS